MVNTTVTYPIQQIVLRDLDDFLVGAVSVSHVNGSLLRKLTQDEEKEFVVVPLEGEVARETLLHRLHDGVLLRVDEAFQHHPKNDFKNNMTLQIWFSPVIRPFTLVRYVVMKMSHHETDVSSTNATYRVVS